MKLKMKEMKFENIKKNTQKHLKYETDRYLCRF